MIFPPRLWRSISAATALVMKRRPRTLTPNCRSKSASVTSDERRHVEDAGVVDEDVDAAERRDDLADRRVDRTEVATRRARGPSPCRRVRRRARGPCRSRGRRWRHGRPPPHRRGRSPRRCRARHRLRSRSCLSVHRWTRVRTVIATSGATKQSTFRLALLDCRASLAMTALFEQNAISRQDWPAR